MKNNTFQGDVCSHSHSFILDNFIRRIFQNPGKIVGPYVRSGDTVVDLGCGPGYFSMEMAGMVGESGRVICVDLQPEMLDKVRAKAKKKGVSDRIRLHRCTRNGIGLEKEVKADFILAFYMVHETPDPGAFLSEAKALLRPGGICLIQEPWFHVSKSAFRSTLDTALAQGFRQTGEGSVKRGDHRVLLTA